MVGEAVRRLVGDGEVDHIDLNVGCPVPKITRHGGGAALPARPPLFARSWALRWRRRRGPVTVKMRTGLDDDRPTYLGRGRIGGDAGVAAVAVHARTAAQRYSGCADWSAIAALVDAVDGAIPVLGNGDIWEAGDALAMMRSTGCDGVVIGRGCLGRPWLFGELAAAFRGRSHARRADAR